MLVSMGVDDVDRETMADGVLQTLDPMGQGSIGFEQFCQIWDEGSIGKGASPAASPVAESPQLADRRSAPHGWRTAGAAAALVGSHKARQPGESQLALTTDGVGVGAGRLGSSQGMWQRGGAAAALAGSYSENRAAAPAQPSGNGSSQGLWQRGGAAATLVATSPQPSVSPAASPASKRWRRAGAAATLVGTYSGPPEPALVEPSEAASGSWAQGRWQRAGAAAALIGTQYGQGPEEEVAPSPTTRSPSSVWKRSVAATRSDGASSPSIAATVSAQSNVSSAAAGGSFVAGQRVKLINGSGGGEYSGVTVVEVRATQPPTYLVEVPGLGKRDFVQAEQLVAVEGGHRSLHTLGIEALAVSAFQHSSHGYGNTANGQREPSRSADRHTAPEPWARGPDHGGGAGGPLGGPQYPSASEPSAPVVGNSEQRSSDQEIFELLCRKSDRRLEQSAVGAAVRALGMQSIPTTQLEEGLRVGLGRVTQRNDGSLSFEEFVQLLGFLRVAGDFISGGASPRVRLLDNGGGGGGSTQHNGYHDHAHAGAGRSGWDRLHVAESAAQAFGHSQNRHPELHAGGGGGAG
jgi:hypothetical protein